MKNKDLIIDPKAAIIGRKYHPEKPWSCVYCYFWKGRNKGCGEKNCYYLLPITEEELNYKIGDCKTCPYGKHSPCIGYCIAKLEAELRQKKGKKQ